MGSKIFAIFLVVAIVQQMISKVNLRRRIKHEKWEKVGCGKACKEILSSDRCSDCCQKSGLTEDTYIDGWCGSTFCWCQYRDMTL